MTMRLRPIFLRRSALYISPPAIRVPVKPYSHESNDYKKDAYSNGPGTELNHEEFKAKVSDVFVHAMPFGNFQPRNSEGAQKLVDDHPNPKSSDIKEQALNRPTATRFSLACVESVDTSEEFKCQEKFASDVENIYRILLKFHSRVPKLEVALKQSGIIVRPGLTERVLKRCGDAGNLGYRFFVWASKQPGYRPSSDVYMAVVKALGKMRQFGVVWAVLEEMRTKNPQMITPEIFVVLMRRFASARMVKNAIQVLDEMPKYGCEADEYVFGCLLDALCKKGRVKEAALLFEEMKFKFKPSLKHFTLLLNGWCREGKLMESKHVLVKMREARLEPDIMVYNILLGGYARAGKMTDAYELLKDMRGKRDCSPNVASYTVLIQALCEHAKMEEATRVFVEMVRSGCKADGVTYASLIGGFCRWGKIERAYEILDDMIQLGYSPNVMTYMPIFWAHEKKEELEECLELMKKMRKTGCFPDSRIYNAVIRLACKLGEVKEGVRLLDEMEANGLSPKLDNFIIMIHGFVEQGYHDEVCRYFKEMVERGLLSAPQYGLFKDLLNKLLRADKLEMAKDVWSIVVSRDCQVNVFAWTIWIHALFACGHVKEACFYCLDMLEAGEMPQPDTFAKLMKGLKQLYNRVIAVEITEKVRKIAAERGVTFKMYKRRGVRDLKEIEKKKEKRWMEARKLRARACRWGHGNVRGGGKFL